MQLEMYVNLVLNLLLTCLYVLFAFDSRKMMILFIVRSILLRIHVGACAAIKCMRMQASFLEFLRVRVLSLK